MQQVVPERRTRLLILLICSMSLLIVGLDNTIVNVALPAIHRSFHASLPDLQWTIDAYTLVLASLLMLSGSTADRLGRRRVFQTGLAIFSLGSLLCAIAPSLGMLIAARALQAIGGSMLNPVAMSIVRNVFVDPRERAQAIGVWGGMMGISLALGPVLGGALVDSVGWPAVFLVNLPIGIAAIILTARYVPESRAEKPRRIDPVGQLLVITGLATLTYAIIEGPRAGWLSAQTLGLGAVAVVALVCLVSYELRRFEPLLQVRFFASAPFAGASAIALCAFAGLGGYLFLNALYLQSVRGLSPFHAGLYTLPLAAVTLIVAPVTGRIVGSRGTRWPLIGGALAMIASAAILTRLTPTTAPGLLIASYVLFGLGFGLVNPPITNTAISGMPPAQAGVAAAVASTSRQVGSTMGVAVLGALSGGALAGGIGPSFAAATHAAWWVCVGLGIIVLVLAIVTTTGWAQDTATRTAERLREPVGDREPAPRAEQQPAAAG